MFHNEDRAMSKIPGVRGFVEIECFAKSDTPGVDKPFYTEKEEFDVENLVVNVFREMLPLLLAPRVITGRPDNSQSNQTWLDRRICLLGVGVGNGGNPPSVKPEEPEDGRVYLIGEPDYPNSKQGLQGPIRRIPLNPTGPSEVNQPFPGNINSYYLFREVDSDGVSIFQYEGGGSEITFTFTIEEDEYIGDIMEFGLYFGGGDAADNSLFAITLPDDYEYTRLSRELAKLAARKTRTRPLQKTRDFKFRVIWRMRA